MRRSPFDRLRANGTIPTSRPQRSPGTRPTLACPLLALSLVFLCVLCGSNRLTDRRNAGYYSHSIVAGGLPEMSYTTRETLDTSLMIRFDTAASTS